MQATNNNENIAFELIEAEEQQQPEPTWREKFKISWQNHTKFWFNRVDVVLSIPRFLIHWSLFLLFSFGPSGADWYYRLLLALIVPAILNLALNVTLSPLAVIFWLIDSRYPLKTRFFSNLGTLFWGGIFIAVECWTFWALASHHVGDLGGFRNTFGL